MLRMDFVGQTYPSPDEENRVKKKQEENMLKIGSAVGFCEFVSLIVTSLATETTNLIMLFHNRKLLSKFSPAVADSLIIFLRTALGPADGIFGTQW